MYGGYNPTGVSPPLPDIIGPYYGATYGTTGGLSSGLGIGGGSTSYVTDLYGGGPYMYDPGSTAGLYGSTSPIRRRRYSIAGLPSASMMNDYYGIYPPASAATFGMQTPLQHASSSNLVNLLNETHKSISRSSQILNHHARMQQAQPITPLTPHYAGRVISSYPTLHLGGEASPHYLSDNLMQMSSSFSSQPNMYFQPYTTPAASTLTGASAPLARGLLRPAYSVTNLSAPINQYTSKYNAGGIGIGSSSYPYSQQSLLNHSDLPYILQQRQLLSSLHASNPAISQYYQQQLPFYLQHYAAQQQQQQPLSQFLSAGTQTSSHMPGSLAYNLQQQFAGSQQQQQPQYGTSSFHPASHIHHSVAQQLNPNHQYHVHAQQNHLQTHPLASLVNSTSPFGGHLASSSGVGLMGADSRLFDNLHTSSTPATTAYHHQASTPYTSTTGIHQHQPPPTHHHHHPHIHHPTAPHTHHPLPHHLHHHLHHQQQQQHQQHHQHQQTPYSKIDLDYPKMPQEHKRQVSFKFDVDQLSLDS